MPPAKRSGSRKSATRTAPKEPAALRRLNKSLDSAQDALATLGKEVGRDVGGGARDLHRNLQRFVKDARRDSGKLGRALQSDLERLQKRMASSSFNPRVDPGGRTKGVRTLDGKEKLSGKEWLSGKEHESPDQVGPVPHPLILTATSKPATRSATGEGSSQAQVAEPQLERAAATAAWP